MKFKLTLVALAAIGTMGSVQATELSPELKKLAPAKTEATKVKKLDKADFGVYKIQPQFKVVSKNTTSSIEEVAQASNSVMQAQTVTRITPNTVVRNVITDELGVMTGNLSVVAKSAAELADLQQKYDLELVKKINDTVVILKAKDGTDLAALITSVKSSGLVRQAKLDVAEKRYSSN